jgi:DEK C terminal domain
MFFNVSSNLDALQLEKRIRNKLKDIMMTVDLEEVTSKYVNIKMSNYSLFE